MSQFDWDKINTGRAFSSLCNSLLVHEISHAVSVFGKDGRDYAIDASFEGRVGDAVGKWVFQYKWSSRYSSLKQTVKREVARILRVLRGPADSPGPRLWHGVTDYVLLTNQKTLPQQHDELRSLLSALPFRVDVWDGAKIEALCTKHPFVLASFFGVELPLFWPADDYLEQLQRGPLGKYWTLVPFVGREEVLKAYEEFIGDENQTALLISGPGGVGKTRALLELAMNRTAAEWHPRFVRAEAERFEDHLAELPPGEKYVLFLDEPQRCQHFERLLFLATRDERFAGSTKVVLACRPPLLHFVETVLARYAEESSITTVDLEPLGTDLDKILDSLQIRGRMRDVVREVSAGLPLWAVLIADCLEREVQLPHLTRESLVQGLIEGYLSEVGAEADVMRRLLELMAAAEPVNTKDQDTIRALADLVEIPLSELRRMLSKLEKSGITRRRGRFIEFAPDLLSDYLLARALYTETGEPSGFHSELMSKLPANFVKQLFTNLARAERLSGTPLLDEVLSEIEPLARDAGNFERQALLDNLEGLALYRPAGYLRVVTTILDSPKDTEQREDDVWGTVSATHEGTVNAIPLKIRPIAYYPELVPDALSILARIAVLQSLRENTGDSAIDILRELVSFGLYKPDSVQRAALDVLQHWIDEPPSQQEIEYARLASIGIASLLKVEVEEYCARGLQVTIERRPLSLDNAVVRGIRARAQGLVLQLLRNANREVRREGAQVAAHAIDELTRAGLAEKIVREELRGWLSLVESAMSRESSLAVLNELVGSVIWLSQYGEGQLKRRARSLRSTTVRRFDYRLYETLVGKHKDWKEQGQVLEELVGQVLAERSTKNLRDSLTRVLEEAQPGWYGAMCELLRDVGRRGGSFATEFLRRVAQEPSTLKLFRPYLGCLLAGMRARRGKRFVPKLSDYAASESAELRFAVVSCYSQLIPARDRVRLTTSDLAALDEALKSLDRESASAAPRAVANLWPVDADWCYEKLADIVQAFPDEAGGAVAEALYGLPARRISTAELPKIREVLDHFVSVSDLDRLGSMGKYYFGLLLRRVSSDDPKWVLDFVGKRLELAVSKSYEEYNPLPFGLEFPVSEWRKHAAAFRSAARRVRGWARRRGWFRIHAPPLLKMLAGSNALPEDIGEVLKEWCGEGAAYDQLWAVAYLLREFDVDDSALGVAEAVLERSASLSSEQQRKIGAELAASVRTGFGWSAPGQPSPRLTDRLRRLQGLRDTSRHAAVMTWASEMIAATKSEIDAELERDAELE